MPIVTLHFNRVKKILGRKIARQTIISTLPFLGLDIEEETHDHVNVEYSPNRPDFSTDYGIVTGLQGLLGIKIGISQLRIKAGKNAIRVDASVRKIRPYIVAIEARNGNLDNETIKQIITMQEDLHNGIGRKRKKISIGIHDLDKVKFPLAYKTIDRTHRFIPLNSQDEMSISEILGNTEIGLKYKHLIEEQKLVPVIVDSVGNTLSIPPIVNSKLTEISPKSKNLLVEVTATDKSTAEDTLAVIAFALQNARFKINSVRISGAGNSTPTLATKNMILDPLLVNKTLGLDISTSTMVNALKKCRLDARSKGNKILCSIPRYRTDILSPIDLVEEVALGYGIQNLEPTIPLFKSAGQKDKITISKEAVRSTMIGLGYSEIMNFGLVGKQTQYDLTKRNSSDIISVVDSKSQEHQILRDGLLPGLIDVLSRNIHESYPQKIFEIGSTFQKDNPIDEKIHLACLTAHNVASYTEIKSILQSFLKSGFNISCKTENAQNPIFFQGYTANVLVGGKKVGVIGEIDKEVLENFRLRTHVAGFEIQLTGLIFN